MIKNFFSFGKKAGPLNPAEVSAEVLEALGGIGNIAAVDACMTRLRAQVEDVKKVDQNRLLELGAQNIIVSAGNIQAVFGTQADQIRAELLKRMRAEADSFSNHENNHYSKEAFVMPMDGKLMELADVPDEVFASKMMGDGFAVEPCHGEVVSPVNGKIAAIFPTKHAISILADSGLEILIHVGIDTVGMKGEGFELFVREGDCIKAGQPLLHVDLDKVSAKAKSTITPIIFTNLTESRTIHFNRGIHASRSEENIITIL
jgi:PTS system D-glucosamine-specific IIC component